MEASLKIGLFLEDVAQERFVRSLILKAAASVIEDDVEFETRNAVGGRAEDAGRIAEVRTGLLANGSLGL